MTNLNKLQMKLTNQLFNQLMDEDISWLNNNEKELSEVAEELINEIVEGLEKEKITDVKINHIDDVINLDGDLHIILNITVFMTDDIIMLNTDHKIEGK